VTVPMQWFSLDATIGAVSKKTGSDQACSLISV